MEGGGGRVERRGGVRWEGERGGLRLIVDATDPLYRNTCHGNVYLQLQSRCDYTVYRYVAPTPTVFTVRLVPTGRF